MILRGFIWSIIKFSLTSNRLTSHNISTWQVVTRCGAVIRISVSNLYKQFKASSTWLQFPYTPAESSRWTVLQLSFLLLLRKYVNKDYSHLKCMKLCANMLIKNAMISSRPYSATLLPTKARTVDEITSREGTGCEEPLPREMRYPVPSGCSWVDVYHLVKLPETTENISVPIRQKAVLPATTPPPFLSATKGNRHEPTESGNTGP